MNRFLILILTVYLSKFCIGQEVDLILPATQGINIRFASLSADGRYFVSTQDASMKVWEIATGKVVTDIKTNAERAFFSHNGKYLVTNTGEIRDSESGLLLKNAGENCTDISRDDRYLLTANESEVHLFDLTSGSIVSRYFIKEKSFFPITAFFSPDDKKIIVMYDKHVQVWDLRKNQKELEVTGNAYVRWASVNPEGSLFVTSSVNGEIEVRSMLTGEIVKSLYGHSAVVPTVDFSPDGKSIVSASYDNSIRIWDVPSFKLRNDINAHKDRVNCALYSADGNLILSTSWDKSIKLWNAKTGRLMRTFTGSVNLLMSTTYSPDGNTMAIVTDSAVKLIDTRSLNTIGHLKEGNGFRQEALFGAGGQLLITKGATFYSPAFWNPATGERMKWSPRYDRWISAMALSNDEVYFATVSSDSMQLWNIETKKKILNVNVGKTIHSIAFNKHNQILIPLDKEVCLVDSNFSVIRKFDYKNVSTVMYSKDEKLIGMISSDTIISIISEADGRLLYLLNDHAAFAGLSFNKSNTQVLTMMSDSSFKLWDLTTLQPLFTVKLPGIRLRNAEFSPGEKFIKVIGSDNTLKYFHATTGTLAWTSLILNDMDNFSWLDMPGKVGYYHGTKNAIRELSFKREGKRYPFEQFDLQYNRPDKVLEIAGRNVDTSIIQSLQRAYTKRLRKLGFDSSLFSEGLNLPQCDFVNRKEIRDVVTTAQLAVHIRAKDSLQSLFRFNLWINEVPLFGRSGRSLSHLSKSEFDTSFAINLSPGINIIEASVTNKAGLESYRLPIQVNFTPASVLKEKLYFVGIGIDRFKDGKQNLNYSVKDIRDLARRLKEKFEGSIIIDTLFNEKVTAANVLSLKKKMLSTSVNDKVILSYSGHGLLSREFDYFLSTHDVDFANPQKNGLPYEALESLLDSIPARQKLMLIDACHSGEVDKEEMQHYRHVIASSTNKGLKGGELENVDPNAKLGMKNSFELMQELFVNVGRSTGATIISAAAGTQLAQERGDLKNGVFTYSILEFMEQNPSATVTELKNYVNKRVPELTNGLQVPTTRTETKVVDWRVW